MNKMTLLRKWCRIIHRDLSYIFTGALLIYAISGIMLNHKEDFDSNYSVEEYHYKIEDLPEQIDKDYALTLLDKWGERENFRAIFPIEDNKTQIIIKGFGSQLVIDNKTSEAYYKSVKERPIISSINRLHYNPNRNWTIFADIFAVCLIIIIITGLFIVKGVNGLWGKGGIEFLIGIAIPIIFILLL